jgi:hypothetical protein
LLPIAPAAPWQNGYAEFESITLLKAAPPLHSIVRFAISIRQYNLDSPSTSSAVNIAAMKGK